MTILLRLAEDRDVKAMAEIRAQRWGTREFWVDRIGPFFRGEYSPQQAMALRAVFVAEEASLLVGFAAGHQTRRLRCDGELQWMDVADKQRRRGIATKLLAAIGSWFVEQGLRRICVNVDPDNTPAREFYAKHGAVSLNEHWMIWEDAESMRQPRSQLPVT